MAYYLLHPNERGGIFIEEFTKEQLDKRLADIVDDGVDFEFTRNVETLAETESGLVIIKGEAIIPKKKEVVTKWELP